MTDDSKCSEVEKRKKYLNSYHNTPSYLKLCLKNVNHNIYLWRLNPIALRKAKIVYNFGLSECNRVKKSSPRIITNLNPPTPPPPTSTLSREPGSDNICSTLCATLFKVKIHGS